MWGVLFSGQGSQKAGSGLPWRGTDAWRVVAEISEGSGHDVADLLLAADDEALRRTDRAQVAVFSLSLLAWQHWRDVDGGPSPVAGYAGHSLGELTALVAAGAVPRREAAALVAARGAAMLAATRQREGTMVAVIGAAPDVVAGLAAAGPGTWVANLNAPGQVVVAGTPDGVDAFVTRVRDAGLRALTVAVSGAFHSPLMTPAVPALQAALSRVDVADRHAPVVSNVDAEAHTAGHGWRERLALQLTSPVRWEDSIRRLTATLGATRLAELGPGKTLTGMAKRIVPEVPCTPVNTPDDLPGRPLLAAGAP